MKNRMASGRRSSALIWLVIFLTAFICMVGLACDLAWLCLVNQELQHAADASSLAGAQLVRTDQSAARLAAYNLGQANRAAHDPIIMNLNDANLPEGDIVLGHFDRDTLVFTPTTDGPNAVKVLARRTDGSGSGPAPLLFAPIPGLVETATANIARESIAMIGGGTGAGLITLCPSCSCAVDVGGTGSLVVNDGAIQVNSNASCAFCANGNPDVAAPDINMGGDACLTGGPNVMGNLNPNSSPLPDPLAALPEPLSAGLPNRGVPPTGGNINLEPGYYPQGIRRNGGTLTCAPGIYYLDGTGNNCNQNRGLSVNGNAAMSAPGCMFFVRKGPIDLTGTGEITISPPDSGVYEHISLFQARDNTCQSRIHGTNQMSVLGTVYIPAANIDVRGTGDGFDLQQLIAWTVSIGGNGTVTINYDGAFPAAGNKVFLVK